MLSHASRLYSLNRGSRLLAALITLAVVATPACKLKENLSGTLGTVAVPQTPLVVWQRVINRRISPLGSVRAKVAQLIVRTDDNLTIDGHNAIEALNQADPDLAYLYAQSAGVHEGYTVQEHTERVLTVGNDQLRYLAMPDNISPHLMFWVLLLHDVAKPVAVQLTDRADQHLYIPQLVEKILNEVGFSPAEVAIGRGLCAQDDLGEFMQGGFGFTYDSVIDGHIKRFLDVEQKYGIDLGKIWNMQVGLLVPDSSSYPEIRNQHYGVVDDTGTFHSLPNPLSEVDFMAPIPPVNQRLTDANGQLLRFDAVDWGERLKAYVRSLPASDPHRKGAVRDDPNAARSGDSQGQGKTGGGDGRSTTDPGRR